MSAENCTTHHRACDCIEARRKTHIKLVKELLVVDYHHIRLANAVQDWLDWEDSLDE